MTKPRNRPAAVFALLFAAALFLIALRSGTFAPPVPKGLTADPCPKQIKSGSELLWATLTGEADRRAMRDWARLCMYRAQNAAQAGTPGRAVLIGDSITKEWSPADPGLFGSDMVNRGVGGQVSPQLLLRFYQDAIALKPRIVHLMIGLNDISGFQGASSAETIRNNFRAMADMAKANGITMILGSITPIRNFDGKQQASETVEFNRWLKAFAEERGLAFADYHAVLAEPAGELKQSFTIDGIHLNSEGYRAIRPVLQDAFRRAEGPATENGPNRP